MTQILRIQTTKMYPPIELDSVSKIKLPAKPWLPFQALGVELAGPFWNLLANPGVLWLKPASFQPLSKSPYETLCT